MNVSNAAVGEPFDRLSGAGLRVVVDDQDLRDGLHARGLIAQRGDRRGQAARAPIGRHRDDDSGILGVHLTPPSTIGAVRVAASRRSERISENDQRYSMVGPDSIIRNAARGCSECGGHRHTKSARMSSTSRAIRRAATIESRGRMP
jgi:hypothetical protein